MKYRWTQSEYKTFKNETSLNYIAINIDQFQKQNTTKNVWLHTITVVLLFFRGYWSWQIPYVDKKSVIAQRICHYGCFEKWWSRKCIFFSVKCGLVRTKHRHGYIVNFCVGFERKQPLALWLDESNFVTLIFRVCDTHFRNLGGLENIIFPVSLFCIYGLT